MSKLILLNTRFFANGVDLTSNSNKAEITATVEDKETTNFGSAGWKEFLGGLASSTISGEGQWEALDASKVDDSRWSNLGGLGPWSVAPIDANVGSVVYFTNALQSDYTLLGQVGEVAPWKASGASSWPLVRGKVANAPGTALTVTGVGTATQLSAVTATQQIYAGFHLLSVAGTGSPTITMRIESDNASGFPSPITVATFTAATAIGGQILRVAGPNTDDWFRPAWTISGTGPSFLAAVVFGVR